MGNSQSRRPHNEAELPTRSTGLYSSCEWDQKVVTRLIVQKKLAPRYKGSENEFLHSKECPICFLNYAAVNRAQCCNGDMCTECFLQVKSPTSASECPFCKTPSFGVVFDGAICTTGPPQTSSPIPMPSYSTPTTSPAVSAASSPDTSTSASMTTISSSIMTPESRRQLEAQMKQQREDCITSESYSGTFYDRARSRSGSYGSSGGTSTSSSDRHGSGPYFRRRSADPVGRASRLHHRGGGGRYDAHRYAQQSRSGAGRDLFVDLLTAEHFNTAASSGEVVGSRRGWQAGWDRNHDDRGHGNANMGGVSVYHNSGEDDLEQLEEFMLMEAMRLSLQESETAKGRVETTDETPISVSSPALPLPPGLSRTPPGLSSFSSSSRRPESVAAPAPAHTAAVSLCDTRETDPPLPVLDLDSADDDVLLSYALSLSQMQDQDSPATATITSSASIRFITPPHIPPADPGSVEIVHVSDSKMGADIGAPVSLSAPPRISFSQSQSSKESVTLKGPAAGSGDAHPKQVGLSEMSFLPQARGTPSESEVNARSVPDSVSPCTSPGLVKKSSSARLLEMIDAALSSPVGEFTGKLSMSDSENDEEVGNRKQSNGDEAGSLHGGGDFFAAESVESALSSSGRCEVEAEESKRKTPTE